jgi:hypothetical protein
MWHKDISQFLKQINDVTRTTAVHSGTPVSVLSYTAADDCLLHKSHAMMMCGGAGAMLHQINLGSRSMSVVRSTRGPLWMHPTADTDSEWREKCISLAGINTRTSGQEVACQWINTTTIIRPRNPYIQLPVLQADRDDTSQTCEELSLLTTSAWGRLYQEDRACSCSVSWCHCSSDREQNRQIRR